MAEVKEEKKGTYDVYDYVFSLEEQIKSLQTEKQINGARLGQLQIDLERTNKELTDMKIPPQIVGTISEVLPERKAIVKNSNGMEFLVKTAQGIEEVEAGKRVAMNQRTLVITEILPENKDSRVRAMEIIEKPKITFDDIGGLTKERLELEEAIILPLLKPKAFEELGIDPPTGVLLHGLPGTGKTLLAKAVANKTNSTFISLSGSDLVRKFIGEGARLVKDVFNLAKEKKPTIIFIDEIDAVGSHRFATANGDREVQRTLMQLLAEMDGFGSLEGVKIIGATNRLDMLDQALLRPGRFDRLIEIPAPDEKAREKILKIHTKKMNLDNEITIPEIAIMTNEMTGADIKSVCTEAGLFALRENKKNITLKNFNAAIEKVKKAEEENNESHQKMFV